MGISRTESVFVAYVSLNSFSQEEIFRLLD